MPFLEVVRPARSHGLLSKSSSWSCGRWFTLESVAGRTAESRRFTDLVEVLCEGKVLRRELDAATVRAVARVEVARRVRVQILARWLTQGTNQGSLGDVKTLKKRDQYVGRGADLVHSGLHFGPNDIKYRHTSVTSAWRCMRVKKDNPRFAERVRDFSGVRLLCH